MNRAPALSARTGAASANDAMAKAASAMMPYARYPFVLEIEGPTGCFAPAPESSAIYAQVNKRLPAMVGNDPSTTARGAVV